MSSDKSDSVKIRVNNFYFSIDSNEILKDINIEIPKNKITVIIGPSGCGKSTLLKSINRMNDLIENIRFEGEILIDDENILSKDTDVTELRKNVGMIAQTPNPLPMSIYDNVAYGPKIHGTRDKNKLNQIVENSLKTVGLWEEVKDRLKEPATKLSLGQQQRLCLARTLAIEPEIILCDETTSALDPISAKHIETELISLKEDYTILFVTHILRQAKRIADYVIFIYLGEIIEHGPADEVFNNPKDERTKAYLEGTFG